MLREVGVGKVAGFLYRESDGSGSAGGSVYVELVALSWCSRAADGELEAALESLMEKFRLR